MKNTDWDIYRCFVTVARTGGLTGAAQATGLSPATVGRRMLELEERTGRSLFIRSQTGYTLTGDGRFLFEQLQEMEAAARKVESWQKEGEGATVVRIAAGTWVSWLIAENFPAICTERDAFNISLTIGEARANLAYRESDIGIRAFEPEETYLAARPVGEVAYAAYRQKNAPGGVERLVAVAEEDAISAYLRWPHEHAPGRIVATVTRPRSLLDLARAGAGRAVLPCFVGDLDPLLERVGDEIEPLRHRQWIVMNNEDRHRRDIRTVVDRMTRFLRSHTDLFAGKRPPRNSA
ncbi:LysR family transcriptional regulator [Sinorhizobium meliloti]|jgi:DNA-binding transcriptional LysR family regulator|uniref:Transcription regulator n=1 Tax=Rhizobium meliloti (strain 1021) TaxID=266834 RepID=Q92RX7_RHIME|nr:LysR family transcriptional regulator [Sinorhizobium meliloti]TWA94259.1 DNA-binding transcriptional LysR family regulator [Ensifer sp. SEMIA 134]TWB28164.1 DNA-binding transcriptional LysR family regulator [Ensifer sp. SEMIA 135]AEG03262.1 transcriptional regulator, LysR family [Sinorhizobium meliloti BL225C]AGG73290.1 Putative transcription regulator [Sinorhizobium meliloti 2011]AIL98535.1 LysR family transcriptional regulator [Sinorhizobium meliloti]